MRNLWVIYVVGLFLLYGGYDAHFVGELLVLSCLLSWVPLAASRLFFLFPLALLAWAFYANSTLAWLSIIYAPMWWLGLLKGIVGLVKSIASIDED